MATKINAEKSIIVGKLKLFNSIAKEAIIIADDELVNYDARFWQVVNDDVKDRAIRLEDIEEKRQKKKETE
ncbi:MAG: hypothetical protein NTY86_02715 [Deltaproteobacteria bacterium]|nr:hypothetical protein [Deltaproteobacteria bacterium]